MEDKIVREHWAPVAVLKRGSEVTVTVILSREVVMNGKNQHTATGFAKHITNPSES